MESGKLDPNRGTSSVDDFSNKHDCIAARAVTCGMCVCVCGSIVYGRVFGIIARGIKQDQKFLLMVMRVSR